MIRYILAALWLTSFAAPAVAQQSPCIWSGTIMKCLPPTGHYLFNQQALRFGDATTTIGTTTNYVELKAPAAVTTYSLVWPVAAGAAGYAMVTDGSGNLSWTGAPGVAATATTNGYLTSTDWTTFNSAAGGGVVTTRLISTTAPLAGGGNLTADRTLSITQAGTNGNGYLSSGDWQLFNAKQATLSAASATVNGYLASTDWTTFNTKDVARTVGNLTEATSSVLTFSGGSGAVIGSGTTIAVTQSSGTANGYLASTDWTTFNNRVATTRSIATTAPLAGGGDLTANRTFTITQSGNNGNGYLSSTDWQAFNGGGNTAGTATTNGYIASADWTTFNNRVATTRSISTTAPLAGGGDLSANRTFTITQAGTNGNGYLSSGDWQAFNAVKGGTGLVGNTTGTAYGAGFIGETLCASLARGTAAANTLTASTVKVVAGPITLTKGIWNIYATIGYNCVSCTMTLTDATLQSFIDTASAGSAGTAGVQDSSGRMTFYSTPPALTTGNDENQYSFSTIGVSVTVSSQTYYLNADATFSAGNVYAYGQICGTRIQ